MIKRKELRVGIVWYGSLHLLVRGPFANHVYGVRDLCRKRKALEYGKKCCQLIVISKMSVVENETSFKVRKLAFSRLREASPMRRFITRRAAPIFLSSLLCA